LGKRPLVLVFIKDGCPCSRAAERFFNRLHAAYKDEVQFLGVIDVDMTIAKTWATVNHVPFPVLADPEFQIIHAYKAESSAYVALVSKDGTIETLWPGYSGPMLTEASETLGHLSGREVQTIDLTEAPTVLTTGCSFE
jgi:peroxiredoxin